MVDEPDNIVLRHLRAIDVKLDRLLREVQALKQHSIATNDGLLALRKDVANVDERMARAELRLDLREAGPSA